MLNKLFGFRRTPVSLLDEVLRVINRQEGKAVNRVTLTAMQRDVTKIFDQAINKRKERWLLFDSIQVVGATIQLLNGVVSFHWETRFFPRQRHANQFARSFPLGYYGTYDLWVVKAGHLPAIVLARYGGAVADYRSAMPELIEIKDTCEHAEALREAHRRAHAIGFFCSELPIDPKRVLSR